ncbi:hypothetical protein Y88_2109 [Novosphingobium nitrogenifigens DSM 19370]|uniref:Cell shape determination protein CcmA n=1 Tax=Novosphingobium nitrogenifigens DSM 19370 TaxID=983920 RepID=F1Z5X5_9SPHN|nr:polymer-forming cytoskeletal protein [Novosphingobium nitrogenifigens]EGD60235.1 hypothetical protein Y88_2109 [Novosphingobium nitrogenifigens DSM 19370]
MANRASPATFSVIGADVALTGDLVAKADLHIDGAVTGDVTCTALVQGESSTITGAIRAESVRLAGTIEGPVDAAQVVVLKTATLRGDVRYDALTIEQGAHVEGHFARRDGTGSPTLIPQG